MANGAYCSFAHSRHGRYTNMTPTVFANSEESLAHSLQTLNPIFFKNGQVRQRDLVLPWLDQNLT
jgi:hypothetical protein